jgi:VWFA-related protein
VAAAPLLASPQAGAELTQHEEPATFKSRVNLVVVPVVVRDAKGNAVGDLRQEDFQLFDSGKPQVITRFSVERSGSKTPGGPVEPVPSEPPQSAAPAGMPERYTLYLFDDINLEFGDLAQLQAAAGRHLTGALLPSDRAAIYTTSGRTTLDFTDDQAKLHDTLMRIRPSPIARGGNHECPNITYYMADQVRNKNDNVLLESLVTWAMLCLNLDSTQRSAAVSYVNGRIAEVLSAGEHEARVALSTVKDAIRRISAMPGQRSMLLVSPGFLNANLERDTSDLIDRAVRSGVVVNALDARGVYTPDLLGDISASAPPAGVASTLTRYFHDAQLATGMVLTDLSAGTGGRLYTNNDFERGFNVLAGPAEVVYMLGFSPQNLRLDGKFHGLKVTMTNRKNVSLQARRGYTAPTGTTDAAETATREIEEALFSREEIHEIPVQVRTQFFKRDEANARVSVVAKLDLHPIRFRQAEGRSCDVLTIIASLFDRNGNLVSATRNTLEMRLQEQTLAKALNTGVTVRTNFDVHPGAYMVRVVVRDSEGQMMSAQNGAVEVP